MSLSVRLCVHARVRVCEGLSVYARVLCVSLRLSRSLPSLVLLKHWTGSMELLGLTTTFENYCEVRCLLKAASSPLEKIFS